ncbi:MAG TPA: hypothetical protein VGQ67_15225, partial [Candidatus Polarisedimenticolia bacterium]|nr:hypothetical protein [Candidatus Polarisedimenticolia bacterium]
MKAVPGRAPAWKALLLCAGLALCVFGGLGETPTAPATIDTSGVFTSTRFEPQRALWQNPRGLHAFYAIIQRGSAGGLQLSRSADGSTWTAVATLNASTTFGASAFPYDDGARLVVYVAYGENQPAFVNAPIFYRRLVIADESPEPGIGAEQNTGRTGSHVHIARDRNGFVHIAKWGINSASSPERGVGIFGSSAADPGDSPAWSASADVETKTGVATWNDGTPELGVFPAGNILGMVYGFRNGASGATEIHGINVASFNGSAYAFGAAAAVDTPFSGSNAYHPFNLVVDSAGTAHILYVYVAKQNGPTNDERYRKAAAPGTVQAWSPAVVLDAVPGTGALSRSVALSIDRTAVPERLYAFAHKGADSLVRWRTSSASATSWSAEETLDDGGGVNIDDFQSARDQVQCGIPLMYTRQAGGAAARFAEISVCALPTPTPTNTGLPMDTPTPTSTPTDTPTGGGGPTNTPTITPTITATPTPTDTSLPTSTPTVTPPPQPITVEIPADRDTIVGEAHKPNNWG